MIAIHKTYVAEDDKDNEIFRVTKKMARTSVQLVAGRNQSR